MQQAREHIIHNAGVCVHTWTLQPPLICMTVFSWSFFSSISRLVLSHIRLWLNKMRDARFVCAICVSRCMPKRGPMLRRVLLLCIALSLHARACSYLHRATGQHFPRNWLHTWICFLLQKEYFISSRVLWMTWLRVGSSKPESCNKVRALFDLLVDMTIFSNMYLTIFESAEHSRDCSQ